MVTCESEFVVAATNLVTRAAEPINGRLREASIATDWARIRMGATNGARQRSLTLRPFGVGADNATFTLTLWARRRTGSTRGNPSDPTTPTITNADGSMMKIGTLVCTLCALTGAATTSAVTSSERLCDTLVWTADAYWTSLAAAFGWDVVTHSPGGDAPAELIFSDLGGIEEIIVSGSLGSATAWNLLAEKQT